MPAHKLKELQRFLTEVGIPEIKPKPKTFLGIARQPHYENVISNIYAFFFNINEEHGFKGLFINSLIDLIRETEIYDNAQLDELDELLPEDDYWWRRSFKPE